MAYFDFICDKCNTRITKEGMSGIQCKCGEDMYLAPFDTQVSVFKPYIEKNMGKSPVAIETAAQRDKLCEEAGLSYDTFSNVRRIDPEGSLSSIGYDAWMKEMKNNGCI